MLSIHCNKKLSGGIGLSFHAQMGKRGHFCRRPSPRVLRNPGLGFQVHRQPSFCSPILTALLHPSHLTLIWSQPPASPPSGIRLLLSHCPCSFLVSTPSPVTVRAVFPFSIIPLSHSEAISPRGLATFPGLQRALLSHSPKWEPILWYNPRNQATDGLQMRPHPCLTSSLCAICSLTHLPRALLQQVT